MDTEIDVAPPGADPSLPWALPKAPGRGALPSPSLVFYSAGGPGAAEVRFTENMQVSSVRRWGERFLAASAGIPGPTHDQGQTLTL